MVSRYFAHAASSGKRRWKSGSDFGKGRSGRAIGGSHHSQAKVAVSSGSIG
jgi:hypothetical protein